MRVFSGIQPTGVKHFGNYSAGFRQYVLAQGWGEAFFCIADLHSITVDYRPFDLQVRSLELAALLFATGIDPNLPVVFIQSQVPAHAGAAWLLSAVATNGELGRMTQFKDKAEARASVSAGLFTYPVLMAADILLYQADVVTIGNDQRQHLEFARALARRFNTRFGPTFRLPRAEYPTVGARIMDLQQPTRKMSTTGGTELGPLLLLDPPEVISRKIQAAVTDSGQTVTRGVGSPGISNLIQIMAVASGQSPEDVEEAFDGFGYGRFKAKVAEAVVAATDPIRRRHGELMHDRHQLQLWLRSGAEAAAATAQPTLRRMFDVMGLAGTNLGEPIVRDPREPVRE